MKSCIAGLDVFSSEACNPLFSCRICDSKTKPFVVSKEKMPNKEKEEWKRPGFHRDGDLRKGSVHSISTAATARRDDKNSEHSLSAEKALSISEPVSPHPLQINYFSYLLVKPSFFCRLKYGQIRNIGLMKEVKI